MWTTALQFLKRPMILIILALTLAIPVAYLKGRGDGKDAQKLEVLNEEHQDLIEATKKITETFKAYEDIIGDVQANPDPSITPKLMRDTIKRLPEPKSKPETKK